MQLYTRDRSPYWWAEFFVRGQRHRFSTKRLLNDKAGAQRFMANEYERLMNQKQFGVKPEITLKDAMERTCKTVKGATKESYELSTKRLLGMGSFDRPDHFSFDPEMLLSNLTDEMLEDHILERQAEGYANNTIGIEVRFMQRVHNLMRRRYATNPDLEFKKPEKFAKSRWLTEDEEEDVLAELNLNRPSPAYDKAHDLMIFLVDTGVRLSEALNMEWSQINMTAMSMEVYRLKTKSLSVVPISDRLHEVLKRLHNQKRPFMEMSRAVRVLRKVIRDVCNTNPNIVSQRGAATIHTLRDTYASRMVQRGMSLHKLSKLLGHTSPAMTAKYAQLESHEVVAEARAYLNQ